MSNDKFYQNSTKKIVVLGSILVGLGYLFAIIGELMGRDMGRILNSILPILGGLASLKFANEIGHVGNKGE